MAFNSQLHAAAQVHAQVEPKLLINEGVFKIERISPGVYTVTLGQAIDQTESIIQATIVEIAPGTTVVAHHVSDQQKQFVLLAKGMPVDVDFNFEIKSLL